MSDLDVEMQFYRTLSIIKELVNGKQLSLPDGHKIGMGEDMSIGYVVSLHGEDRIASELTLKDLNDICETNGIYFAIPEGKR